MRINMLTLADIRNTKPCYDPNEYLPETWMGTVIDLLSVSRCPPEDRLFVALRLISNIKVSRLFAVACAREAMRFTGWADTRSVSACDVAERYANGLASEKELRLAAAATAYAAAAYATATAAAFAATKSKHRIWQIEKLKDLIIEHADRPTRGETK